MNFLASIRSLRYFLEIIALPFFVFLVVHLAGHGVMTFFEGHHAHAHEEESHFFEVIFSEEVLFGVLFLLIFVWIWHRPTVKKWVPCAHEHCHTEQKWAHFLAMLAFCLHFFPEAEIRHHLLENFSWSSVVSLAGFFGFFAHFLVDVLVAILLSSYFSSISWKIFSFLGMVGIWLVAFFLEKNILEFFPEMAEGSLFLISAFLLAMFVHLPHRKKNCACEHDVKKSFHPALKKFLRKS